MPEIFKLVKKVDIPLKTELPDIFKFDKNVALLKYVLEPNTFK